MRLIYMLLAILGLSACGTGEAPASPGTPPPQAAVSEQEPAQQPSTQLESDGDGSTLKITFGDYELLATFEDNPSAEAFKELLSQGPVTIEMSDSSGCSFRTGTGPTAIHTAGIRWGWLHFENHLRRL